MGDWSRLCLHLESRENGPQLLKKEQAIAKGDGPSAYAPIAQLLHELPEDALVKLRIKIDLAYFVATEKLAFCKYLMSVRSSSWGECWDRIYTRMNTLLKHFVAILHKQDSKI